MIVNELQHKITMVQVALFQNALSGVSESPWYTGIHPRLLQAEREAMESHLADLHGELAEYYRRAS